MVNKRGTGLHMVFADIPADKEDEFNRWYDEEHIGDILALPGVLNAARYVAVSGGPKYLTCYELETPDAMWTPEYENERKNSTEWTKKMNPRVIGTEYVSNIYQQIHPGEVSQDLAQSEMAPVLQIGRMNVTEFVEDEFNRWYNTVYVPNYEKVPGCIRARRYRTVSGWPLYSVVYEFEHEKVSQSPEWLATRDAHPDNIRMRGLMTHANGSPGIYKKIFPQTHTE